MARININITDEDKKALDEFCFDTGLDLDTLFNVYIKKIIHLGKIPFEIDDDPFYSESNIKALEKSVRQYNKNQVIEVSIEDLLNLE